jgi:hypothetical protein
VGSGVGQFGPVRDISLGGGIAVDASGDIYVGDLGNHRVQKFNSAGEFLLMFGGEVDKGPNHPGDVCTAAYFAGGDNCGAGAEGKGGAHFIDKEAGGNRISVGSGGSVFVGDADRIQEFESDGVFKAEITLGGTLAGEVIKSLAVNNAGDFYLTLFKGGEPQDDVQKISSAGTLLQTFSVELPWAIALDADENLYAVTEERGSKERREVIEYGLGGEAIIPAGSGFSVQEGAISDGGIILLGLATNTVTAAGGADIYVSATNGSDASFISAYGPAPDKWPPPPFPPEIDAQYVTSVDSDAASVEAEINPKFWQDTSYYLEYGTSKCSEGGCPTQKPLPPGIELGAGIVSKSFPTKPILLSGLSAGTTYHYRFVAKSSGGGPVFGVAEIGGEASFVVGREAVFNTPALPTESSTLCPNGQFRTGASTRLPDCRAYEMVSPLDKNNTDIVSLINVQSNLATLDQSTPGGEKIAYTTSQGFGDSQGTPYVSQYIASRDPVGGWQSHGVTPSQGLSPIEIGQRADIEFRAFTPDLCTGALRHDTDPPLVPGPVEGSINVYLRHNCGADGYEALTTNGHMPEVQGLSGDGSCAAFADKGALFESCNGQPHQLNVLPSGKPSPGGAAVGTGNAPSGIRSASALGAVSSDGSRVYWTAANFGPAALYLRENPTKEQSKVVTGKCTEAGKACTVRVSGEDAHFWGASPDGSRALYTIEEAASSLKGNLYQFDLGDKIEPSHLIATQVRGVIGTSEDTSRVSFVSSAVLTSGGNFQGKLPTAGAFNLYLFDANESGAERYRFIGTLSSEDARTTTNAVPSPLNFEPYKKTSRVSTDGRQIAFMSNASLTGYDNVDANNGKEAAEVFAYDATAAGGKGLLRCASCNPTGQRPTARNIPSEGHLSNVWAAALLPPFFTELYGSRAISEDGRRVFFNSYEELAPGDTNGKSDVYQWEAVGSGDCVEGGRGFSPANEGCLSLISSGQSPTDSEFVDASADGRDIFFTTASSLLPQDPGLIDIYDARVEGGFPPQPSPPPACEGEACQSPPAPPADPVPASSMFNGFGNVKKGKQRAGCAKGKVRRKGRCVSKKKQKQVKKRTQHRGAGKNLRAAR